ncbi:hypothetical protein BGZ75_000215 [Mortierella antarctica]|nr:hypothetical protein BGZ75_000215 [Mortierella antarctica]
MSKNDRAPSRRVLTRGRGVPSASLVSLPVSSGRKKRVRSLSPDEPLIRRHHVRAPTSVRASPTASSGSNVEAVFSSTLIAEDVLPLNVDEARSLASSPVEVPTPAAAGPFGGDSLTATHVIPPPAPSAASAATESPVTTTTPVSTPPHGRRDLQVPDVISIRANLRYGAPLSRNRVHQSWPEAASLTYNWNQDSLDSLRAKVKRQTALPALRAFTWPSEEALYVKPSHNVSKQHYFILDEGDYESKLRRAWINEARRLNAPDDVVIDVFAYLTDASNQTHASRSGGVDQIRRSSKGRVQEAQGHISKAINEGQLPKIGKMTQAYFARHLAKRPALVPGEPLVLPQTATCRQIQHLDKEAERLMERNAHDIEEGRDTVCQLEGVFSIKRSHLRRALGLPDMTLDGLSTSPLKK